MGLKGLKEKFIVDDKQYLYEKYWELYHKIEKDIKELHKIKEMRNKLAKRKS